MSTAWCDVNEPLPDLLIGIEKYNFISHASFDSFMKDNFSSVSVL